jgi:hypothetical protein
MSKNIDLIEVGKGVARTIYGIWTGSHSPSLKDMAESFRFQVRSAVGIAPPIPHHSPAISEPLTGQPKLYQQTTINPVTGQQPEQNELTVDQGFNQSAAAKYPVRSIRGVETSPLSVEEIDLLNRSAAPSITVNGGDARGRAEGQRSLINQQKTEYP